LNWYAFLVGIGASFAIWQIVENRKENEDFHWPISGLWILVGSWLGSRLAYFIWQPAALVDFGWQSVSYQQGGMVWPGAVLGAWVTVAILTLFNKKSFLETADRLIVMLPPLAIMIWMAAWFSGSAYGQVMQNTWWVPISMDDQFQYLPRFPLQIVAAATLFLLFINFEPHISKRRPGMKTAVIWLLFSIHSLVFSYLRADHRPEWSGIAWDIWFAYLCLVWAVALFGMFYVTNRNQPDQE